MTSVMIQYTTYGDRAMFRIAYMSNGGRGRVQELHYARVPWTGPTSPEEDVEAVASLLSRAIAAGEVGPLSGA